MIPAEEARRTWTNERRIEQQEGVNMWKQVNELQPLLNTAGCSEEENTSDRLPGAALESALPARITNDGRCPFPARSFRTISRPVCDFMGPNEFM